MSEHSTSSPGLTESLSGGSLQPVSSERLKDQLNAFVHQHHLQEAIPRLTDDVKAYADNLFSYALEKQLEISQSSLNKIALQRRFFNEVIVPLGNAVMDAFLEHHKDDLEGISSDHSDPSEFSKKYLQYVEGYRKKMLPLIRDRVHFWNQQNELNAADVRIIQKSDWEKKTSPAESRTHTIMSAYGYSETTTPATHNSHQKSLDESDPTSISTGVYHREGRENYITYTMRLPSVVKGKGSNSTDVKARSRLEAAFDKLDRVDGEDYEIFCHRLTSIDDRAHVFRDGAYKIDEASNHQTETARLEIGAVEAINRDLLESTDENPDLIRLRHFMQLNVNQQGEDLSQTDNGRGSELARRARLHNELAMIATLYEVSKKGFFIDGVNSGFIKNEYKKAQVAYQGYLQGKATLNDQIATLSGIRKDLTVSINHSVEVGTVLDSVQRQAHALAKLLSLDGNAYLKPENTWLSSVWSETLQSIVAGGCKSAMDRYSEAEIDVRACRELAFNDEATLDQGAMHKSASAFVLQDIVYDTYFDDHLSGLITQSRINAEMSDKSARRTIGADYAEKMKSFITSGSSSLAVVHKAHERYAKNFQCSQEVIAQRDGFGHAKLTQKSQWLPIAGAFGMGAAGLTIVPAIIMLGSSSLGKKEKIAVAGTFSSALVMASVLLTVQYTSLLVATSFLVSNPIGWGLLGVAGACCLYSAYQGSKIVNTNEMARYKRDTNCNKRVKAPHKYNNEAPDTARNDRINTLHFYGLDALLLNISEDDKRQLEQIDSGGFKSFFNQALPGNNLRQNYVPLGLPDFIMSSLNNQRSERCRFCMAILGANNDTPQESNKLKENQQAILNKLYVSCSHAQLQALSKAIESKNRTLIEKTVDQVSESFPSDENVKKTLSILKDQHLASLNDDRSSLNNPSIFRSLPSILPGVGHTLNSIKTKVSAP